MADSENGWVKLYHPGGVQVTLPITIGRTVTTNEARSALDSVSAYLSAGWTAELPGLEAGDMKKLVGFLARRVKENSDGSQTSVIDVYGPDDTYKAVHVYLNDDGAIENFLRAFGLKALSEIPAWEGDAAIQRGQKAERDRKYLRDVKAHGVSVIYGPNPKWEGEGDKKHAKWVFKSWVGGASAPAATTAPSGMTLAEAEAVTTKDHRRFGDIATDALAKRAAAIKEIPPLDRSESESLQLQAIELILEARDASAA